MLEKIKMLNTVIVQYLFDKDSQMLPMGLEG